MDLKVLGTGCTKCRKLYAEAEKAVAAAGLAVSLSKVENIEEIVGYGVMMTPALVLDGQVRSTGRIPPATEIQGWLEAAARG